MDSKKTWTLDYNWFKWYLLIGIGVPDTTLVYIRGWMQMVFYYHMIFSPETINQSETLVTFTFTIYNDARTAVSQCHIHCAWWVLDVASSPSGCPPGSPMDILSPPLLQIYCLSGSPLGGPGPPSTPLPMVTPFPSGSTHYLISPSATLG
jgi:hypothetical protein